ncbi:hypothetical protein KTJ16_18085 [Acinetobacter bereziniae]|uniref:hypothetical protein n=1 Tax=Acinetobacter bereziniae TaxID=106648 RepID=UPI000EF65936|nr:hypothetical protein [Acinetobacter bereziniae]MBJ8423605.1 hypothetical protein [Acinetobacter bereziniae]MCU4475885.1 hypothetical protein [Acinetobacter bereziniae]MCU4543079.1 hypothetical protein [Acinetobacter bereziniae]MCU4627271.1 hypothetical protein [Acinetobacter bereziniae]MDQ9817527.1 hypothetical protein [Acinetobacter bereziniae]
MSAEFYVTFQPVEWYRTHRQLVIQIAQQLQSYQFLQSNIVYLKATTVTGNAWEYDVRLIFEESQILLEISAINDQLRQEIKAFLALFGQYVLVDVIDDDGEQTTW